MATLSELQIYEKGGLFNNIIDHSKIMNGRYAAICDGRDLNANNVISMLEAAKEKYPITVCTIPQSAIVRGGKEDYTFNIFFLCNTTFTGDNQIKQRDPGTNTSLHKATYDINDMKMVCQSFLKALEGIQQKTLGTPFHFKDNAPYLFYRIIEAGNDKVSGISVRFNAVVDLECDLSDIDLTDVNINTLFTVPTHAPHFH